VPLLQNNGELGIDVKLQSTDGRTSGDRGVWMAAVGLCVHSVADGIALGASLHMAISESANGLGPAVLVALMLHKIPEALGFGSYLKTRDVPQNQKLACLLLVAGTSPVTAFLTYSSLGQETGKELAYFTALILLFSAGTFLYVAGVHILPEVFAHT
jgi:zinc transporter 9